MFKISKEFDFDYGHRVHNQKLDAALSENSQCKCRHLHGHTGKIIVELSAEALIDSMVIDFNNLKFFKKIIDDIFDHKTILDINDPMLDALIFPLSTTSKVWKKTDVGKNYFLQFDSEDLQINPFFDKYVDQETFKERLESFVFISCVPTSENLCYLFYEIISSYLSKAGLSDSIKVTKITFKETPKTSACYEPSY